MDPDREKQIDKLDESLFLSNKPRIFHGSKGYEISSIKQFEETCFLMDQLSNRPTKDMTVLEFFQANEYLHKQAKKAKKVNK